VERFSGGKKGEPAPQETLPGEPPKEGGP